MLYPVQCCILYHRLYPSGRVTNMAYFYCEMLIKQTVSNYPVLQRSACVIKMGLEADLSDYFIIFARIYVLCNYTLQQTTDLRIGM